MIILYKFTSKSGFPSSILRLGETILEKWDNFESSSSVNWTAPFLPVSKSCLTVSSLILSNIFYIQKKEYYNK